MSNTPIDNSISIWHWSGLEVLNTRHQFFLHHDQNVQLGAIAPYIETLKELQSGDPALLDSVAGTRASLISRREQRESSG